MTDKKTFKGFRQVNGLAEDFNVDNLEEGYIYFVRTNDDSTDGYLFFNGRKYATAADVLAAANAYTDKYIVYYFDDDTDEHIVVANITRWYNGEDLIKEYDIIGNLEDSYYRTVCTRCEIGSNVTAIGSKAFSGCTNLTSIVIPDSVTSIGSYAFSKCGNLQSITIPDSVTSIGSYAFSNCSGLTSINIPNSVRSITSGTFSGCTNLTSIMIPDSVTSIGEGAFYACSGLSSINIPDSVTTIGANAFNGCSGLTSINIPNSLLKINSMAFAGSGLLTITIPNDVASIESHAFYGCRNLASVVYKDITYTSKSELQTALTNGGCTVATGTFDAFSSTGLSA